MRLTVTIDVEEEGLFGGTYGSDGVSSSNVSHLMRVDTVFRKHNIRPTLLVAYQPLQSPRNRDLLVELADRWNGEIGAHLHHWSTPPFETLPYPDPVPSELMPTGLLKAKFETLMEALDRLGVQPRTFRMGRFNIGTKMLSILEGSPIRVDSSVAPLRKYYGGPDHLTARLDPYYPDPNDILHPGCSRILEVPLTIVPVLPKIGATADALGRRLPMLDRAIAGFAKDLLSLPVQPYWTGLRRLKLGTLIHRRCGGEGLTIFFHSSELMPGGSPKHKTDADVDRFVDKLDRFFTWLDREMQIKLMLLSELTEVCPRVDTDVESECSTVSGL